MLIRSGKEGGAAHSDTAERQQREAAQSMQNLKLGPVGEMEADAARWSASEGRDGGSQPDSAAASAHSSWAQKARQSVPGAQYGHSHAYDHAFPPVPVPQPVNSQQHARHADDAFEGEGDAKRKGDSLYHTPQEWQEYPDVPVPKEWTESADTLTPPPSAQKVRAWGAAICVCACVSM